MSNLVVEIGNTAVKAALSEGMTLGKTFRYQGEKRLSFIFSLLSRERPEAAVIASVSDISATDERRLRSLCPKLLILDSKHSVALAAYDLPDYLSFDRAAGIIAARHLFKGRDCVIFDFGTTISIDFLKAEGKYVGGNVSPGLMTRLKSLNRYSKSLPLVNIPEDVPSAGDTLENSIAHGVVSGIMFEIQGYIDLHKDEIIIFTGGDAIYFAKRMKNSIFAICNLVLLGLALIIEEYVEKKNE